MRNMIESGDIAVPALYPGIVRFYSRAEKCFRLDYVDVNGRGGVFKLGRDDGLKGGTGNLQRGETIGTK